ncbi:hypothetical protein [Phormidesmis priestleyi]|nr:hypothetical protein [Phormidesmis priestleyi]
MVDYVVRILSFCPQKVDIVHSVLACPEVDRLIFPAVLYTGNDSTIPINSADQFNIASVSKELVRMPDAQKVEQLDDDQTLVIAELRGENNIEFSSTINLVQSPTPNVINLRFSSEHLQSEALTLSNLKKLFSELISVFQADHASIYDRKSIHRSKHPKYLRTANFRSYPIEMEWLTYFGPQMIELLGHERFTNLHTCVEKYDLHGGTMVILQEDPFDEDNPQHQERRIQAERELHLS